jgi:hypothetical protein
VRYVAAAASDRVVGAFVDAFVARADQLHRPSRSSGTPAARSGT